MSVRRDVIVVPETTSTPRRRTVAARVLLSYVMLTAAFSVVAGWSVLSLRAAGREANLMRVGYLPLARALRDVVSSQDTWNTQLNHITTTRNPADKELWFETALRVGRPRKFAEVRAAVSRAFISGTDDKAKQLGRAIVTEIGALEAFLDRDQQLITSLFMALDQGGDRQAEQVRDELVNRGYQATKRISEIDQRVMRNVDVLLDESRARERLALSLLFGLAALTILLGAVVAIWTRRVLAPLLAVTKRAQAVAAGDLEPRPIVPSNDEIGELSATFESMVRAISRANEQLLSSERLATIGKMAAHVTHEIRNPLSSLALNVELLEDEVPSTQSEAHALLIAIKAEVERLTELSAQYLSMARQRPPSLRPEELEEVAREVFEFSRRELERKGIEFVFTVEGDSIVADVDEAQLKQALFNLIRNAKEAIPGPGGRLELTVRGLEGFVEIVVEDDGNGIDPDTRAHLFEPFFTTKSRGTGIGLAITRQIVETHGGSIACGPGNPRGTRFTIRLPLNRPAIGPL